MESKMRARRLKIFAALAVLAVCGVRPADAQTSPPAPSGPARPKVFLDWPGADLAYFQSEIGFVEFVAALDEAQVRVAVTEQKSEGRDLLTLSFAGQKEFQGDNNTLTYTSGPGETPEDLRKGTAGLLKAGLMRYAAKTPVSKYISVKFLDQVKPTSVVDKWDFWVFSLSANSFLSGESQYFQGSYYGSFSANRVTPALKVRMSVNGNFSKMRFKFPDEVFESQSHGYGFSGLVVKSLSEHWSAGAYVNAQSSTYMNLKLGATVAPAVEFNVFPYSESTKRQFRILYRVGVIPTWYNEETIYFKTRETLIQESLSFAYEVKKPWGTVSLALEGSNYLHDFSKNRLELGGEVSVRVWKGLSFEVNGSYARIRDLLALERGGATYEEVLLRRRQLATGYQYFLSAGFSFSFGSTKSTVVNPRFGGGSQGISISM